MFLNFGASLHGHEFSSRQEQQKQKQQQNTNNYLPSRNPLARSAFSTPLPSRNSVYENPLPIGYRLERPLSDYIPRSIEHTVRFRSEPETMSEDISAANSDSDISTSGRKRRRRSMRTTSTYHLAHPAPTLTQKQKLLHIRPKLLLQLQRISANSRPKPSVDVLPSTVVVPRLARKFPRMFRGKDSLGCNDVMVVRSEDYNTTVENNIDDSDSDEDGLANRDLIAVICQMPNQKGGSQGKAEIVLHDGSVWTGEPLSTGSYEFFTLDERGNKITARWVRRNNKRESVDTESLSTSSNTKYTFSIIDPNSRRHPIMATINQSTLDVPDSYTSVSRSSGRYPPTSPMGAFSDEPECSTVDEIASERTSHTLDDRTKILIQVTGIWVALREGWSPYFKYNDAMALAAATPRTGGRVRSSSLTPDTSRTNPGISSNTPDSTHSTLGAVLGSKIRRVSAMGMNGTPSQSEQQATPQRTVSAGSAFMRRAVARRMGTTPSIVASDSEGESFMAPPRRAATEHISGHNIITPPPLALTGASTSTPETPTRPQRRSQSAYIPHSVLQNSEFTVQPRGHTTSISDDVPSSIELNGKRKFARWKALTNFFRRTNSASRSD